MPKCLMKVQKRIKKCSLGDLTFIGMEDTGKTNIKRGPEAAKAGEWQ